MKGQVVMKILLAVIGVLVAAIVILYIGRHTMAEDGQGKSAPGGTEAPPEVAVVAMQPEPVTITTELPGRTCAYLVAEVRPQVNGLIQKRLFEEGADVKQGDLLYQIDPALYQAAVDNADANLAGARITTEKARAVLKAGLANATQQEATLDLCLTNRQRIEALVKDGAVSLSDRDKAVTDAKVAEATLGSAQAQVNSNRQAVAEAETSIQQAEAALKAARINLEYTRITAPISGRIGISNVTVGALVTAHQPLALASIQQLDPIYVDVTQSTAELLRLRRRLANDTIHGDGSVVSKVRLVLEDGQPYAQEGALQFRDVTVDQSTGSVLIRIVFPNPDAILLPGMFVRAIITEGVNPKALLVPQQAVTRDTKGQPIAMIVDASGKVEQRVLTLDRALGDRWLVSQGLAAGDRVIVEGLQRARAGSEVKAVPFHKPRADGALARDADRPAAH
ncbi:MAG: efflux RND transporter periplasmic adaptor subunit [bacterium]|nr:efflux RND transporter periplasmic adaptor subunit [bacterium]